MNASSRYRGTILVVLNILLGSALFLAQPTAGAPPRTNEPFANSVAQRAETNTLLTQILAELKTQNDLLRSGHAKAIVIPSE